MESQTDRHCLQRDNIMVAYLLAVNHQNETASQLDNVSSELERTALRRTLASAMAESQRLRAQLVAHCSQHQC
jgi:hypothetical protein